jgi:hypothetical protein
MFWAPPLTYPPISHLRQGGGIFFFLKKKKKKKKKPLFTFSSLHLLGYLTFAVSPINIRSRFLPKKQQHAAVKYEKSRRRRAYPQQIVTTRLLYCLQDPFAHLSRLQRILSRSCQNYNSRTTTAHFRGLKNVRQIRCEA